MKENKTRRKIGKRTMIAVFAVMIAATLIASGAILSYYGKIETTANVDQSVVIREPGGSWLDYNDIPIKRTIDGMINCHDYTYKAWIWNRACSEAPIGIEDICTAAPQWDGENETWDDEGFEVSHYILGDTQTIRLVQKEVVFGTSTWAELVDGKEALLTFGTCNQQFVWNIESESDLDGYSLIYYANYPDYWQTSPVFIIGGLSGSVDIPTMPYIDDENALRQISDLGETYAHQYGAKFWLVPSSAIIENDVDWNQAAKFLFETDLGLYVDCDDLTPIWMPLVYNEFATTILQPESEYCWLTNYHVALNIWPGTYAFNTWLNPT